jgi:tryptophan synthase alpha subunit
LRTDKEQIAWYRDIRALAEKQLKLIEEGWRFQRSMGDGPTVDVTDEMANQERRTVETMDRLIQMYEARFS